MCDEFRGEDVYFGSDGYCVYGDSCFESSECYKRLTLARLRG